MDPRYSQHLFKEDQEFSCSSQELSNESRSRKKLMELWIHYHQLKTKSREGIVTNSENASREVISLIVRALRGRCPVNSEEARGF